MTTPTLNQLTETRNYIEEMVAGRPDGEVYLPLLERLELEIEAKSAKESAIDRARRRVRERAEAELRVAA